MGAPSEIMMVLANLAANCADGPAVAEGQGKKERVPIEERDFTRGELMRKYGFSR